jgi:hypothetical protein
LENMRTLVARIVLFASLAGIVGGCGWFPLAKYPPGPPPRAGEPVKTIDVGCVAEEAGVHQGQ